MRTTWQRLAILLVMVLCGAQARGDDDIAVSARKTQSAYQNAIVTIRLTLQTKGRGRSVESKRDILATVIDSSGLCVAAAGELKGEDEKDCKITEAQMHLPNSTEISMRIVLKDEDLGLAFIAPQTPLPKENTAGLSVVPLSDGAKPEPPDECFLLARLDKEKSFASSVVTGQVIAKRGKPRLVYVASIARLGCPAFDSSGKLIGVFAALKGVDRAVIVPAADVARNVAQALDEAAKAAGQPATAPSTPSEHQ